MTVRTPPTQVVSARAKRGQADEKQVQNGSSAGRPRGSAWLLTFLAVLGSVHALVMVGAELYRNYQVTQSIRELAADVAELQEEVAGLAAVVEHGDDPIYREQLARKQGYIYPDEILIVPRRQ